MMASERSKSTWDNFGKFISQFQPKTKTLVRKLERILMKLYRQNVSLSFDQTCLNERLQPNHTHIYYMVVSVTLDFMLYTFISYQLTKCASDNHKPLQYIYICMYKELKSLCTLNNTYKLNIIQTFAAILCKPVCK